MIKIDLSNPFFEQRYSEIEMEMRANLSELGYSVLDEGPYLLVMDRRSENFFLRGFASLVCEDGELHFKCCVLDRNGEALRHPHPFLLPDREERECITSWVIYNPDEGDINRWVFGVMESYLAGATNIKPIITAIRPHLIPGKSPWRRKKRKKKEETAPTLEEAVGKEQSAEGTARDAEVEYETAWEYVPPKPPETPDELKVFYLLGERTGAKKNDLKKFGKNPGVTDSERAAFDRYATETENIWIEESKGFDAIFNSFNWTRQKPERVQTDFTAQYQKVSMYVCEAFGISEERLEDMQDIVAHIKLPEFYKNRAVRIPKPVQSTE